MKRKKILNGISIFVTVTMIFGLLTTTKMNVSAMGEKASTIVTEVTVLDVDYPVPGQTPDYTATTAEPSVYKLAEFGLNGCGMDWSLNGELLSSQYRFVAGKTYRLEIKIEAAESGFEPICTFGNPIKAFIGESQVKPENVFVTDEVVTLYFDFPCVQHTCQLEKVEGKDASCKEAGVIEHYKCISCLKTFEDKDSIKEIADTTIPMLDHDWDSMYTKAGDVGHYYRCMYCDVCTEVEEHIYGEFTACMECGYKRPKELIELEKKIYKTHSEVTKSGATEIARYAVEHNIPAEVVLLTSRAVCKQKVKEIKGAKYLPLSTRAIKVTKKKITISWEQMEGVDGYIVFGGTTSGKFKELKMLEKDETSFTHSKRKKGTYYKYIVVGYTFMEDANVYVAVSKTVHVATTGGEVGNAKDVKVNKSKVQLKKGKTFTIKASAVKEKKKIKTIRGICFESGNEKIATVSSKGVIKAKRKGTCYIYVYAQNGVCEKIKVKVK